MIGAINIRFPDSISLKGRGIYINLETPYKNIVSIDHVDYIPYYLDNLNPGNKGGNSHVLKLKNAQSFEDENYPSEPDMVIKMCRSWRPRHSARWQDSLFAGEIIALLECNSKSLANTVKVLNHGLANLIGEDNKRNDYRYYTMPYAQYDLSGFLAERMPSFSDKIELCIEICESLRQIWSVGYYHRDIKPDNILFTDTQWVLSDLGLARHRDQNTEKLMKDDWVGPRGWMSPESMNRYLASERPWSTLFDKRIDHQSDIFQLGKVFWYILQGNAPEGAIKRSDFKWKDDHLYQIIRTMLNHSKNRRYKNIEVVIDELKRVSHRVLIKGEPLPLY